MVKEYLKIVPHYINIPNHFGLTPLGIAVNNEDENMVNNNFMSLIFIDKLFKKMNTIIQVLLLLLAGADVNIGLCTKRTPLHV